MILSANNLSKSFLTDIILNNISFQINEKEKVAVVGINGSGKTTLFKLITNNLTPDSGNIIISNQTTIGYLPQNSTLESNSSIYEEVLSAKSHILKMEEELFQIEQEISKNANNQPILNKLSNNYDNLRHEFESLEGYSYKSKVKGVLRGLGFVEKEFDKKANILSGGQKTRLALAKILVSEPDILLLDEPTNHLDINATEWLENYLLSYGGTLLIISHDRYFLDKIVTKVIELEQGNCTTYMGNYSFYTYHKSINQETVEKHYENQQKEIKRQEEIIKQLRAFNREKSLKRAKSREKTLAKIDRLDKPIKLHDSMKLKFKPRFESGKDVLSVKNLKKSFSNNFLFENVSFDIYKGDKIALIGANGTGKTTILKILTNQLDACEGQIKLGANVHIGYYDQEQSMLNLENNIIEEISDTYPNMNNGEIRNVLASFLFTKDDVFKQIRTLSGGEKARIILAKLMLSKSNFLLLDEPTNHLDIVSREILEKNLKGYTGTIFFISHDRYFINKVATGVLDLKSDGVTYYQGNYDYYIEKRNEQVINQPIISSNSIDTTIKSNKEQWLQKKEEEAIRRKNERLLLQTEDDIHNIEAQIEEIDLLLCQDEIYTDHIKVQELTTKKSQLENKLSNLFEQWEALLE